MKNLSLAMILAIATSASSQTIRPDQVRGTAAVSTPAGNQTITQPLLSPTNQTTLSVNSLNGVLNPMAFPGADLGAQINNAFATCHSGVAATAALGCTVKLPPGSFNFSTPITMGIHDSLVGSGKDETSINFTGTGTTDAVVWTSPTFLAAGGSIHDIAIYGNSSMSGACVHVSGITSISIYNAGIYGCNGSNGVGLLLEDILTKDPSGNNIQAWIERINIYNTEIGKVESGNFIGLEFINNGGSGSFDYSNISITMNVTCGGKGIYVGPGTDLFQSQISLQGNVNSGCGATENNTEALSVKGLFRYSRGFIGMEGGSSANVFHVYSTGQVLFNGTIHAWVNGANASPVIDSGGVWQASPFVDFGFPNGASDGLSAFTPFIQRQAIKVSSDGTIAIASGNNMSGFIDLVWPWDNGRFQDLLLSVSCNPSGACNITTLSNQSITNPPVFTNPRIVAGSTNAIPHLLVNVGNRNVNPQVIYATAWGASTLALFPTDTPDTTVVSHEGLTVHSANTSGGTSGITWGNAAHDIIPSTDNLVFSPDGAIPAGTCTLSGYFNAVYNGHAIHVAACQ